MTTRRSLGVLPNEEVEDSANSRPFRPGVVYPRRSIQAGGGSWAGRGEPVGVSVLCPEVISTRIGNSDRNRPPHLKRGSDEDVATSEFVESTLSQAIDQGLPPSVMAERVVNAIHANQLYILSEEGGAWRAACDARLDDLRLARNPSGPALTLGN